MEILEMAEPLTLFELRRRAVEEDMRQLQADVDDYNANHLPPGRDPISFDDIDLSGDSEDE